MIQAITFDLWNTLFNNKDYREQRISDFFQILQEYRASLSHESFIKVFDEKFHFSEVTFEEINYRHIYTEDRILRVLKKLNIEISQSDLEKLKDKFESVMLQDPPTLKKGVKSTLNALTLDFKIGLISNTGVTPGTIISKVLERYNILHFFDTTIYSDETGYFKPHPKMFKLPLKKMNCKPKHTIHVGDKLETDVTGAKDFNMVTIWFNDSDKPKSNEIIPDYEIKQISEILPIANKLKAR